MSDRISVLINRLDDLVANKSGLSQDQIGSYIVGETIASEGIEELYAKYPLLEEIAELGSDLETERDPLYQEQLLNEIKAKLAELEMTLKD